jgi:hypothetical protein
MPLCVALGVVNACSVPPVGTTGLAFASLKHFVVFKTYRTRYV